jgi:hypothetical protein
MIFIVRGHPQFRVPRQMQKFPHSLRFFALTFFFTVASGCRRRRALPGGAPSDIAHSHRHSAAAADVSQVTEEYTLVEPGVKA